MLEKAAKYFEVHPLVMIVWVIPVLVYLAIHLTVSVLSHEPKPQPAYKLSASRLCEDLIDAMVRAPVLVDQRVTTGGANDLFVTVEGVRYFASCEGTGDSMRVTAFRKTMQY